jgi:hypothetical protein
VEKRDQQLESQETQGSSDREATNIAKQPYEKPEISSTDVFESFTLQSCNQFPGECGGALE